jgi:hypothetical protein
METSKLKALNAAFVAAALVAGCGGGGSSAPPPPPTPTPGAGGSAEGAYAGTTSGGNGNRAMVTLLLDDGTFYLFFSPVGDTGTYADGVDGVVQGVGTTTAASSSFSAPSSLSFDYLTLASPGAINVSATYVAKTSLTGTLNGATNFTGSYLANYDAAPSLATLAGAYSGKMATRVGGGRFLGTATIDAAGAITGSYTTATSTCSFTGTAAPRAKGNTYTVSWTFGASCPAGVQALSGSTGHAYLDAVNKRLFAAAPSASRADAVVFVGQKP